MRDKSQGNQLTQAIESLEEDTDSLTRCVSPQCRSRFPAAAATAATSTTIRSSLAEEEAAPSSPFVDSLAPRASHRTNGLNEPDTVAARPLRPGLIHQPRCSRVRGTLVDIPPPPPPSRGTRYTKTSIIANLPAGSCLGGDHQRGLW